MGLGTFFLVARCPCCCRQLWPKQIAKLLGIDPVGRAQMITDEVAFVAHTIPKRRGWKPVGSLRTLAELVAWANSNTNATGTGDAAVKQLQKLARTTLERMWVFGLLTREDLLTFASERVAKRPARRSSSLEVADAGEVARAVRGVHRRATVEHVALGDVIGE